MELKMQTNILVVDAITNYKIGVHNSPFMAIIEFGNELDEKETFLSPDDLYEDLLKPLNWQACLNLLYRLVDMQYFIEIEDDDEYLFEITDLGKKAIANNTFYEPRNGALRLFIWENKVVKVEELKNSNIEDDSIVTSNYSIDKINKECCLKNKEYVFEGFERKCIIKNQETTLTLEVGVNNSKIKVLDYEEPVTLTKEECINELLTSTYRDNYSDNCLQVDFNPDNLLLKQEVRIDMPKILGATFNPITLKDILVRPKPKDVDLWFRAILRNEIEEYFFSEEDFSEVVRKVENRFDEVSRELISTITRKELASHINDFYVKSKLEAAEYLNY